MLIPYATDAPIYHRPFGTVALIVAHLGVQINSLRDPYLIPERLCLSIGSGIHPREWFTYSFSHGHFAFALASMLVLWVFGLIVEGKVGWWKFLSLYFSIAIAGGAIIQIGTLWMEPFSAAGASGAEFGILVIACFWAPLNEISFVWVLYYRGYYFEATALTTAFMYIAFVFAAFIIGLAAQRQRNYGGFDRFHFTPDPLPLFLVVAASTLIAGVIGLGLAVLMLHREWVDCEGYDALTLAKGDATDPPDDHDIKSQLLEEERISAARPQVTIFLEEGKVDAAIALFEKLHAQQPALTHSSHELRLVIDALMKSGRGQSAMPYMSEFIDRFPGDSNSLQLEYARLLLRSERPTRALQVLGQVAVDRLSQKQIEIHSKLTQLANKLQSEGAVELQD